jgi:hypothetical protein
MISLFVGSSLTDEGMTDMLQSVDFEVILSELQPARADNSTKTK